MCRSPRQTSVFKTLLNCTSDITHTHTRWLTTLTSLDSLALSLKTLSHKSFHHILSSSLMSAFVDQNLQIFSIGVSSFSFQVLARYFLWLVASCSTLSWLSISLGHMLNITCCCHFSASCPFDSPSPAVLKEYWLG